MRKESKHKGWNEIKTNDSWAIFKIMGEFVSGYEKMSRIGPCVSIFGSARTKPDHKYYKLAENIAKKKFLSKCLPPTKWEIKDWSSKDEFGDQHMNQNCSTIRNNCCFSFTIYCN